MEKLTTTIRREPLCEILKGTKKVEYREIKEYWEKRLQKYQAPFLLRLINGMSKNAPELTVIVLKIKRDSYNGLFELHLGEIVETKNCDTLI
ncbi:MAG: hypothetical protein DRJ05_06455 [Bacteroidetes bacterium]|nr:MAG: hypothetical protein DRJ05_06455 [Bacteroidota bacterium]